MCIELNEEIRRQENTFLVVDWTFELIFKITRFPFN